MSIRVHIRSFERGLRFVRGDFRGVLGPGSYWRLRRLLGVERVEIINLLGTEFVHELFDVIIGHPSMRGQLHVVDLGEHERALIWKDGRLFSICGPGRTAYWTQPATIRVERFDVREGRLEHPQLEAIRRHPAAATWLYGLEVDAHETTMLFRDGVHIDTLREGLHVYWRGGGKLTWKSFDRRECTLDIAGQEIMTKDKVTLRVNMVVAYRVTDPQTALAISNDLEHALYREAQFALREAIGERTLDGLLGEKSSLGGSLRTEIASQTEGWGVDVRSVGLRDVILPGEMKTILNRVIEAEKQAQADLIRRREETAAARSQANTAKLLAENPTLARLKELEALRDMLAGVNATFVFGAGDLSDQMRGLIASRSNGEP